MLHLLKQNKAQAISSEYVIMFSIVAVIFVGMSLYAQRAIQSRVFGARETMLNIVAANKGPDFVGNIFREYEPYYVNRSGSIRVDMDTQERLLSVFGTTSGLYRKTIDDEVTVDYTIQTLPPKDAD
jgi:hypothetical protein